MQIQDCIIENIKEYPGLFEAENYEKSEILVLSHLFLVNGNGYKWFDGYLYDCVKTDKPKTYNKTKYLNIPKNFNTVQAEFTPYPICEYCCLVTMPKNIRTDWKEGAIRIIKITIDYYNDFEKFKNHYYFNSVEWVNYKKEQLQYLHKCLNNI